ncbi:MAG: molybdopterin-dependent oxidoreductase [Chloroflexi bacterium]|nr:molybdopterin-dependent oxidoreductase [Chloroflexota bacterium]
MSESAVYCTCSASGCAIPGGVCLLKVHVKDGVMTRIEAGDPINRGISRDHVCDNTIRSEMFQCRPCSRGYSWRRTIYHEDRAKYPMKRAGKRGSGKFVRISWDEALDTIAARVKETADKYGPNCILGELPVLQLVGPWNFITWGLASHSGYTLPDLVTLGYCQGQTAVTDNEVHEYTDIFNTRLILLFGSNAAVTERGMAYWLMLARERGIPVVIVDPSYSVAAEVFADQWIPIRPGTDLAMLLAMANVLFKENLYDADYAARFVEPAGFRKWEDYVLGRTEGSDGKIDRTPEWAEKICGVPAETIRDLTQLYVRSKPCHFRLHRAATRQLYGENAGRAAIYLQAMTGNLGVPGGGVGSEMHYGPKMTLPVPSIDWKSAPPAFPSQRILWYRGWMDAILLREKLDKGKITEDDYRRTCGVAHDWPLPNIGMVWLSSQVNCKYQKSFRFRSGRVSLGNQDLNKVFRALRKVDFVVAAVFFTTNFHTLLADIVLPLADPSFEEPRGYAGLGDASNYFVCGFKAVEPPGEARPLEWVMVQLAARFGVAEQYSPRLADVADNYPAAWDKRIEELLQEAYEKWTRRHDIAPREPPLWQEFKKLPVFRIPHVGPPAVAFEKNISRGKPFDTPSGKIEFHSSFLADPDMARKSYVLPQRKTDNECCFGGSVPPVIPPIAQWMLPSNSMLAPKAEKYPLTMLTPRSFHRQNTTLDNNPWNNDEFRHSVHISVVDARTRGIKDGDIVRIYNQQGEITMPAYVTSRLTPGVVHIPHGAWPELTRVKTDLMPEGIDRRGADNFLTSSEYFPWVVGAVYCSELVQVEKLEE